MKYHLVKQQDEVDSEGYKQSQEPQVVEISGQVVLKRKAQAEVKELWRGKSTSLSRTKALWLEVHAGQVLAFGNCPSRTIPAFLGLILERNQKW